MKQIFVRLVMTLWSTIGSAQQISVVWPFSMADTTANFSRTLIEEINKAQKKYVFVYEHKPGAGASIAAKHVATTPNSVLSASTAFFVRPIFYSAESHRVEDFQPLMTQCATPMVIISKRYKSWQEIDRNQRLTIGISGLGATSHLLAMQISKIYPNAVPVPYKSTTDAMIDTIGGNIDISMEFVGSVEGYLDRGDLNALGITGPRPVKGIPTLESQGFKGMKQAVNTLSLLVPKSMPPQQFQELRALVVDAAKKDSVKRAYSVNYCDARELDLVSTQRWYQEQIALWRQLAQGITIDAK